MTQQDTGAGQRIAEHFYPRPTGFCGQCGAPRGDQWGSVCSACGVVFDAAQPPSPVGYGLSPNYVAPLTELRMTVSGPQPVSAPWDPLHHNAQGQAVQEPVVPGSRKKPFILIAGIVALVAVVVVAIVLTVLEVPVPR